MWVALWVVSRLAERVVNCEMLRGAEEEMKGKKKERRDWYGRK
jgi:hypothetical protein